MKLDHDLLYAVEMPPSFEPGGFCCGEDVLDDYLRDGDAARDASLLVSRTYLICHDDLVVGYFSVLADAIRLKPTERPAGMAYPSAPALKLGRVAVERRFRGQDIGSWALRYVLGMARELSTMCGCRYVTLDALNKETLIAWYEKHGFKRNEGETALQKVWREINQAFKPRKPHPLRAVSMRFDILLDAEAPMPTPSSSQT